MAAVHAATMPRLPLLPIQFGVYSFHTEPFFEERVRNFIVTVKAAGCPCSELPETSSEHITDWEASQRQLIQRLAGLQKPVGIFAANDQLGVRLLDACQHAGIAVGQAAAAMLDRLIRGGRAPVRPTLNFPRDATSLRVLPAYPSFAGQKARTVRSHSWARIWWPE